MLKYKILILVYLISVVSSPFAHFLGINVQTFYRVPLIGIRWIDVSILWIMCAFIFRSSRSNNVLRGNKYILRLCFLYLGFQTFQLLRTWGAIATTSQISWFICTLNFFILIDLLFFRIDRNELKSFFKFFSVSGSVVMIIVNIYLFHSFMTGNVIHDDSGIRVAINVIGQRETVSTTVLVAFVYSISLYYMQKSDSFWKRCLFITSILSIYISLIYSFHRGLLVTIFLITLIYIIFFSNKVKQILISFTSGGLFIILFYSAFGHALKQKGYDPVEKIMETVEFTADVENPNWDKGRSIPREYALDAWKKNFYIGTGYNDLYHFGLPDEISTSHNFIITSLFHNGIIGTLIYLLILLYLFSKAIGLWFVSKQKSDLNTQMKLLILASFLWIIPFWTQEVLWEKYSLSIQFIYLGLICNWYSQRGIENQFGTTLKINE